jgi:hypothetical protein
VSERAALWGRLRDAALVQGDAPAPGEDRAPWFVRVMLGFAGWLGALFLLLFVGIGMASLIKNAAACVAVGALVCGGAGWLLRSWRGDFASQFGFAFSLAGQGLLALGIAGLVGERKLTSIAGLLALQQAALFILVPSFSHRIWCAWSASYAAVFALGNAGLHAFGPAAITAAFLFVWLREFEHAPTATLRRAAGYGLALTALTVTVMHGALWHAFVSLVIGRSGAYGQTMAWAGAASSALVLIAAVVMLLRREGLALGSGPGKIALTAAIVVGAASLKAPGLGPAVSILVVGYANGNRVLAGAGIAALVGYLGHYYYAMQTTLLEKSALLAATGIALLIARVALRRWWPLQEEAAHA